MVSTDRVQTVANTDLATQAADIAIADVELTAAADPQATPKRDDPYLVTFDEHFDPENPKDWSAAKKWTVTDVLSATGFNRIMVSTIMAPAINTIARELDMNSTESVMALSIYLLATVFGPVIIGPLSEVWGRQPILHASNIWFLIWNIVCGFAETKGTLIAARFLAGFGASAIYALAGGVLGDVWRPEQRGKTIGIYLLIPLLGAAVGPIIGGFMAQRTTWRWMFWSTSIFQAVMIVASFMAFHETSPQIILRRRAEKLRRETGDQRYYTVAERLDGDRSISRIVGRSLTRPLRLLTFHPIVQAMAILSGFSYGVLYIVLSTFSDLWVSQYHQRVDISGLHYLACAFGEIAGSQLTGWSMDKLFGKLKARRHGEAVPEFHLPLLIPGAVMTPIFLVPYGWTAEFRVHWAVVDVCAFLLMFSMQSAGQPLQAYVIDSYPEHASSATAAAQVLRSLGAFAFPLFATKMYKALGYGWGNTMLAFVWLVIALPAPLLLWRYGARLRARAGQSY